MSSHDFEDRDSHDRDPRDQDSHDRNRGDAAATEREELTFFLDRLRDAVVRVCDGLSEDQLRRPGVPSGTSLLGLLWHLRAVEVHWFRRVFLGEPTDVDFSMDVPGSVTYRDVAASYREACAQSDLIVGASHDLGLLSKGTARLPGSTAGNAEPGEPRQVSMRQVLAHMIEETGRHAGHADILRELTDGATDL